jgi:uncharacterized repeat protein (TIGR01451 family)
MFVSPRQRKRVSVVKLAAALTLVAAWLAVSTTPTAHGQGEGSTCTDAEPNAAFSADQQAVLDMLRPAPGVDLTTLKTEADLAALAALGYNVYPHQRVSFRGMGWDVYNARFDPDNFPVSDPAAGRPTLLLYEPSGENVTDPRDDFDFPYTLRGWVYLNPYNFAQHPLSPLVPDCIAREEWFVHERGLHPFQDGGMKPDPPDEDVHGTAPRGTEPEIEFPGDIAHARFWSIHIWCPVVPCRGGDVPIISMLNPGEPIRGIDPGAGSSPPPPGTPREQFPAFYYPQRAADLSITKSDSTDPVSAGEPFTYTLRVDNSGPSSIATDVRLVDLLPREVRVGRIRPSEGSCRLNHRQVTCSLGAIPRGASVEVTIAVRPTRIGTIANEASVTARELDLKRTIDPERGELWIDGTADNTDTEDTTVVP